MRGEQKSVSALREAFDAILLDAVAREHSLEEFLGPMLDAAVRYLALAHGLRIDGALLLAIGGSEPITSFAERGPRGELAHRVAERMLRQRRALHAHDLEDLPEVAQGALKSVICVPLDGSGGCVGCVYLDSRSDSLEGVRARGRVDEIRRALSIYVDAMQSHQRSMARIRLSPERAAIGGLAGRSAVIQHVRERIALYGPMPQPVLLLGEAGSGKKLAARALHRVRGVGSLLPVDVAACSAGMVERELFGERPVGGGGYGAAREGLLLEAGQGTLLLIEVALLSEALQEMLLRAIRAGRVDPVGEGEPRALRARLVSTTRRDLHSEVLAGRFRARLLDELCALEIRLPPLRDRFEDLPELTAAMLVRAEARLGLPAPRELAAGCIALLKDYYWPGNVAELELFLRRISARARGRLIWPRQVQSELREWRQRFASVGGIRRPSRRLSDLMRLHEGQLISDALRASGGVRTAAAQQLGIPESTLRRRIKILGLGRKVRRVRVR